jgi:hypothetical protein
MVFDRNFFDRIPPPVLQTSRGAGCSSYNCAETSYTHTAQQHHHHEAAEGVLCDVLLAPCCVHAPHASCRHLNLAETEACCRAYSHTHTAQQHNHHEAVERVWAGLLLAPCCAHAPHVSCRHLNLAESDAAASCCACSQVSHASACMQVLHSAALLAVVQTMAYGAITASPSAADPRNRLIIMKNPSRGKQRAYLLSHVNKVWLSTYADRNSSVKTVCTQTATVAVVASISLLEHAIGAGYVVTQYTLNSAVDVGNLSVIQYLVKHHDVDIDSTHCEAAARSGRLHVLQWLHVKVRDLGKSFEHAAAAGHLHILQWAHRKVRDMSFEHAAAAGHLHILQWAHEHRHVLSRDISGYFVANIRIFAAAAEHGDLHLCQWLKGVGCDWSSDVCKKAAQHGHLAVLKWAREKGCPWNSDVCRVAASNGHLEVLKWAVQNGCPRYERTCETAARYAHLEVLQWAAENGFVFNSQACMTAALDHGYLFPDTTTLLAVLQYLHEQGCQLTGLKMGCAVYCAVKRGSIDMLQWLRDHGCAWSTEETRTAASFGHLHVLKWLREQGCPWSGGVMAVAALNRDFEMMEWLHDAGCPREDDFIGYMANVTHDLYMYKWIFDHGYPWYRPTWGRAFSLCDEAERLADPDILVWLMAIEGIPQNRTKQWNVRIDALRREKRANDRRHK